MRNSRTPLLLLAAVTCAGADVNNRCGRIYDQRAAATVTTRHEAT